MTHAITVEHLTKSYLIKHQNTPQYTMLRDVITSKVGRMFKGGAPSMSKEEFLALDDVGFDVMQGDRIGIIGRNGAGKSTLLKILSRIVAPTKGRIVIDGRVASLLEVGTGFHPELSGRENIFLNGSILGMAKPEIASKFDEIVEFSGVERFLDTPVKRYSSGMYVRLAFAVAAHLEPDILIVDEVLAVGDAEFQRKCLGKMQEVSGIGRTVLFVSHNMEAVQKLCNKGLLLDKGRLITDGPMATVIEAYLNSGDHRQAIVQFSPPEDLPSVPAYAQKAWIETTDGKVTNEVPIGRSWKLIVEIVVQRDLEAFVIAAGIMTAMGLPLRTVWSKPTRIREGRHRAIFHFNDIHFTNGLYRITIGLSQHLITFHYVEEQVNLLISEISEVTGDAQIVNTKSGLIVDQARVEILAN